MKNNLLFSFGGLLLAALFLQSCATHGPALIGNTGTYMAKPVYDGAPAGAVYFSARANKGYVYYDGEKNRSFELAGHISFIGKYFFYSGGLYGYLGTYRADTSGLASRLKPYNFRGFGIRNELGVRIPLQEKLDLLAGINLEFFSEGGEYDELTTDGLSDASGIDGVGDGLSLDVRYTPSANRCFGLRYSLEAAGDVFERIELLQIHRLTLHTTFDRVTLFGQLGFAGGRKEVLGGRQQVFSGGLTYAIPFGRRD